MKKLIITIYALTITGFMLFARNQNQEKQYTVTLPIGQWQIIMDCLNKSNDEHLKVVAAVNFILPQLQKQISDTSTKKK